MSSNYMNAENTIATIVESMLPTFSDHRLGLHMIIQISADNFELEKSKSYFLRLLFIRPSNYTKVLTEVIDDTNRMSFIEKELNLKLKSDHDSCWRSDGLRDIFDLLHKCCNHVALDKPFNEANPNIFFSIFGGGPQYVLMKPTRDNIDSFYLSEDQRYGKKPILITIEKKLSIKEAAEYLPDK